MNAAAGLVEVRVPDMGNFKDVAVIDVLVKPGESIEPETPLVTLETEKATMDVPSTAGGVIEKVHVAKGGKVNAGDLVATVRSESAPQRPRRLALGAAAPSAGGSAPPPQRCAAAARGGARRRSPAAASTASAERHPARRHRAAAAGSRQARLRAASAAAAAAAASCRADPAALRTDLPPINEPGFSRAHAGPSVRKFARELGVDLARVAGHGFKGRITHETSRRS